MSYAFYMFMLRQSEVELGAWSYQRHSIECVLTDVVLLKYE